MTAILWFSGLSVLALALSAVALLVAGRKTTTAAAKSYAKSADEIVSAWTQERELFAAQRDSWIAEFGAISDRCGDLLDTAEKKRRRAAASESRANQGGGEQAPTTRADVIEAARARMRSA